jgi:tRNA A-37 threonylcarbamoyl transferase component Bud32
MGQCQAGQIILGKYQIDRQVGEGSFGEVYLVTHLTLRSQRVIKILTARMPGVSASDFQQCRNRFQLEAQLGARLEDQHVVRVYDFGEENDLLALEMEYAAGGSLAAYCRSYRSQAQAIPVANIIQLLLQAADGLGAIHALGVIHRDLSPSNILLDKNGVAKIADLGLAYLRMADYSMREKKGDLAERHPGTPRYMSPEQETTTGALTPASDVYALGLILFELLAGVSYKSLRPEVAGKHLPQDAPTWLVKLMARMLAPDPALRPADGAAVAAEIRKCLEAASASQRAANAQPQARPKPQEPPQPQTRLEPQPQLGETRPKASSKPLPVLLIAGVVLLLAVSIPVGWFALRAAGLLNPTATPQAAAIAGQTASAGGQAVSAEHMSGDFRVAVAEFTVVGANQTPSLGKDLAVGVFQGLQQNYADAHLGFSVTVWGPDKVRSVTGASDAERSEDADRLARAIGADILVYGQVDVSQPVWKVTPEFYISSESFYQADEINGAANLGAPFDVLGSGEAAHRLDFSGKMLPRVKSMAQITVGLAYLSTKNYDKSISAFQAVETLPDWQSYEGKEILYLLIGNAALSAKNTALAEENYLRSLQINPNYSRAFVGLGAVYYLGAIRSQSTDGLKPSDIDAALLEKSIATYHQAATVSYQPPMADIPTKVHFGLGQCYMMQTIAGKAPSFKTSVEEFKAVIADYGGGANPRLRILAGESHARIALIYQMSGNPSLVSGEYQQAADLFNDDPERQALYQKRADETK